MRWRVSWRTADGIVGETAESFGDDGPPRTLHRLASRRLSVLAPVSEADLRDLSYEVREYEIESIDSRRWFRVWYREVLR